MTFKFDYSFVKMFDLCRDQNNKQTNYQDNIPYLHHFNLLLNTNHSQIQIAKIHATLIRIIKCTLSAGPHYKNYCHNNNEVGVFGTLVRYEP